MQNAGGKKPKRGKENASKQIDMTEKIAAFLNVV